MSNDELFDSAYVGGTDQTAVEKKKSDLKEFLKEPLIKSELERYGSSKPKRLVIRAKITND